MTYAKIRRLLTKLLARRQLIFIRLPDGNYRVNPDYFRTRTRRDLAGKP